MADAHNRLFVPNVEDFFNDLLQLLYRCEENDLDEGVAEITCRRLEEYQQTLRVMYSRVREYRPNEAVQFIEDLEHLLVIVSQKIEQLQLFYSGSYFIATVILSTKAEWIILIVQG